MKMVLNFILILFLFVQTAHSSSRIDVVMAEDAIETLQTINIKKLEIREKKLVLEKVEIALNKAKKGQTLFIQLKNVGGTLIIVAIAVGTYKAHMPFGMRFLLGSYLSMSNAGEGLVKLSLGDIQKMSLKLIELQIKMKLMESDLDSQIKHFCTIDSRHELCSAEEVQVLNDNTNVIFF